ncbi:cytochrome P450 3A2-like [Ylistrum balloti]|uniref:cytochrome P450 3A2-like n=1 Tax=Ylistrum balloti TaxID=509963 RepID=UPI002905D004|nr:cytochrome P450 3A2-like [Ylistrum balloti]
MTLSDSLVAPIMNQYTDTMEIVGIDVPVWGVLTLLAICIYTFMMSRDFWTFKRMGIPGPTPLPIIGNLASMIRQGQSGFDQGAIKKYGKVFGHFDMMSTNLVVADKEMLREILVKQFNNFPDRLVFDGFSGDFDHSIINIKGEHWKHERSIITPTFSSGKLKRMMPLIQEACDTLIKTSRNALKDGNNGQVEMKRLFGGFAIDVISSTAFGIHVDSQSNPDDPFVKHVKKLLDTSPASLSFLLISLFPALKPLWRILGISVYSKDSMAFIRRITSKLVEERKNSKKESRSDFLQLMVDALKSRNEGEKNENSTDNIESWSKQKGMSFDAILANAELFFAAGYETTSITLTMNAYNLALNPECQDKLRQEIEEEIGSSPIDHENVQKLQYLDMCINETLRMYPPAMRFERVCVKTTKVKDITIPAGMAVSVPVYAMQNDPDVWGKPDVFNPQRFSPAEKAKHDPLDYIPFGYGPRNCIGMRLALLEAKMATVHVVRNFRLSVGSKTDIPPKLENYELLKPTHLWLKMEEIE